MADQDYPGAHGLDYFALRRQIRAEAGSARAVIVVQHGGNEYNPIPSPMMVEACRSYIEAASRDVVNIHTHCPKASSCGGASRSCIVRGIFIFRFGSKASTAPSRAGSSGFWSSWTWTPAACTA